MSTAMRFPVGKIYSTPGAVEAMQEANVPAISLLKRHVRGDWGDLCAEDKAVNEEAVRYNLRLLSSYTLPTKQRIWIITEADRSSTTFLLPDEY